MKALEEKCAVLEKFVIALTQIAASTPHTQRHSMAELGNLLDELKRTNTPSPIENCTICGHSVTGLYFGHGGGVAHSECYEQELSARMREKVRHHTKPLHISLAMTGIATFGNLPHLSWGTWKSDDETIIVGNTPEEPCKVLTERMTLGEFARNEFD